MASRRDPSRAPTETSANRQCPPRKETRSPSGRCVHRAASSRTYCRPEKREGRKKTRATTSPAFWAAGNRRCVDCADSRLHRLPEPHETQRSYHQILSILTLYRLSPIILNEHTLRRRDRRRGRGIAGDDVDHEENESEDEPKRRESKEKSLKEVADH